MKNEIEIKQQLEDAYQYRLKLRLRKFLSRDYRNCLHNRMAVVSGDAVGYCSCVENSSLDKLKICNDAKCAEQCSEYVCKHTRQSIESQMLSDVKDPKLCGQKEPKLAVLLWVLTDGQRQMPQEAPVGDKDSAGLWRKLLNALKSIFGFASK